MGYALVTGASKGIGKEMAIALAKRKYDLLLIARSESLLKELATSLTEQYKVQVSYKALDLSDPAADTIIYNWIRENSFQVSFLVNNAGYGLWGNFEVLTLPEQQNMIYLNTVFPVNLTHRLLPLLKQEKSSYILNVASTASYQAVPSLTVYAATKSFLLLFSRGLRYELKDTGVSVSCLSPGPVKTGFIERAGMQAIQETADRFGMNADEVAETAIRKTLKGTAEIIPGFTNKLGVFFSWLLPKRLIEGVVASVYNKKK